ncbi:MAG: hypothetical protein EOM14_16775, partial [Clostridia bacterium]|nr:hypothetical protein [Clostridia bacterium]
MKKIILSLLMIMSFSVYSIDKFETVQISQMRFKNASELTISAGGAITVTQTYHTIDTYADAASDELATITATNFAAGGVCYFKQANAARVIVFKNGTGNIITGAADYTLENGDACAFIYDGTNWLLAGGGGGITSGGSSTDNAIVRWDGTDGDTLQNSLVTIDDSGSVKGMTLEAEHTAPTVTIHNTTKEDGEGGRIGKIIFKGEQSGGEETTLGAIEFSHEGTSDDEKGKLSVKLNDGNDGNTPTERFVINSAGNVGIGVDPDCIFQIKNSEAIAKIESSNSGATADGYC